MLPKAPNVYAQPGVDDAFRPSLPSLGSRESMKWPQTFCILLHFLASSCWPVFSRTFGCVKPTCVGSASPHVRPNSRSVLLPAAERVLEKRKREAVHDAAHWS